MKQLFYLFIIVIGLASCKDVTDLQGLEVSGNDAEFAIPLINSKVSFNDLLENFDQNTFVEIRDDGLVVLRYKGDILTTTSEDIFSAVEAAIPPLIPVLDTIMPLPFQTPTGLDMDSIVLKTGKVRFGCKSLHQQDVDLTVTFPEMKKNGEALMMDAMITHGGGTEDTYIFPFEVPLAGYSLVADDNGFFNVRYDAILEDGSKDTLTDFFIILNDLTFSYAEGFLGEQTYEAARDTIYIDFFRDYIKGEVWFQDPKITFQVISSFGIPTRSQVNVFDVYTADGEILPIFGEGIEDGIDFNYPTLDEVGQTKTTTYAFSKENSNIDTLLGSKPIAIDYDFDATTNPDNISTIRGFVTDESEYVVNVDVELPIFGRADRFLAVDSFDVNFSSYDNVESAEFKVVSENGIPLEIAMQMYFVDANDNVLDSLLMDDLTLIEAAPVDGDGLVTMPQEKTLLVPMDGVKFDKVRSATAIKMNALFSTTNAGQTPVKILNTQQVNVRMGMKLKLKDE